MSLAEKRARCELEGHVGPVAQVLEMEVDEEAESIQQTQQICERCALPYEAW
jgi:hypothetical protein